MNGLNAVEAPPILGQLSSLCDTTRSRILLVLQANEFTVTELCSILQLPQSTVSRHLKVLSDEGWVDSVPEGTSRRYYMSADIDEAADQLWALVRERVAAMPAAVQDARRVDSVLASRRSRSQQFFAEAADRWDDVRTELFGPRADLHALLGLMDTGWTVGDLGCGTGSLTEMLAPFVGRVIGVDGSPEMIDAARSRLGRFDNVELRRGELETLPIDDDALDLAVIYLVLHYVVEPERVIREAGRVLASGGRLLIADLTPHDRKSYRHDMGHVWLGFSKQKLGRWLRAVGFDSFEYRPLPPDPEARGPALFTAVASAR